jgi:hypothetical protein
MCSFSCSQNASYAVQSAYPIYCFCDLRESMVAPSSHFSTAIPFITSGKFFCHDQNYNIPINLFRVKRYDNELL